MRHTDVLWNDINWPDAGKHFGKDGLYELFAQYVMPHFTDVNANRDSSYEWCTKNQVELTEKRVHAAQAAFDQHEAELKKQGLTEKAIRANLEQQIINEELYKKITKDVKVDDKKAKEQ